MKFIIDGPRTGAANMARDEALLTAGAAALRFYQWAPPCVSIGYFQNTDHDIDLDYLKTEGIDIVRRPTGGRAVLHEDELTYAIVLPERLLPKGTVQSYRAVAEVFLAALGELGLECEVKGPDGRPDRNAGCFASTSAYEICFQGRKIMGSAQVRRNGVILQHGSLLLSVDYQRQARCLKGPSAVSAPILKERMAGLREFLGEKADPEIIIPVIERYALKAFSAPLPDNGDSAGNTFP
jgi:lipoate-protein ligase A